MSPGIRSEADLAGVALALCARAGLSAEERALKCGATRPNGERVNEVVRAIADGGDPLGDALCRLRSPARRRPLGATYTPKPIVEAMTAWGARQDPARVVDPGAGSGRFIVAAGRALPGAELVAVELDPLAALLTRAHLHVAGLSDRATVVVGDYRDLALRRSARRTLFLGNPPYVRHHRIDAERKAWLASRAKELGFGASQLAGLHVHFFLATALYASAGDIGALITAAEWLDVNYGSLVRRLLTGPLGLVSLDLIEPTATAFADAETTAVVSCFELGTRATSVAVRRAASLDDLGALGQGQRVRRDQLEGASRWTPLTRASRRVARGMVELGELCRVHRGQVTGANGVWIAGEHSAGLPRSVLYPSITKARELFAAGATLATADGLRHVIDVPADLDVLDPRERRAVERFLKWARSLGADQGFIARHRRPWWKVGLRAPAPILATYMARRPPAFVRNLAGARHINIAHGIYPRQPMTPLLLDRLAEHLSSSTSVNEGRTYAGGLTKFEPREMERLLVPSPESLARGDA